LFLIAHGSKTTPGFSSLNNPVQLSWRWPPHNRAATVRERLRRLAVPNSLNLIGWDWWWGCFYWLVGEQVRVFPTTDLHPW